MTSGKSLRRNRLKYVQISMMICGYVEESCRYETFYFALLPLCCFRSVIGNPIIWNSVVSVTGYNLSAYG